MLGPGWKGPVWFRRLGEAVGTGLGEWKVGRWNSGTDTGR